MSKKLISFVIPAFNEESNIDELVRRLTRSMMNTAYDYECIFVDDGSSDHTLNKLTHLNRNDARIKLVSLSRNFGHQNAISAGLDYAKGDAIITMDCDLQHPPELVSEFIKWWEEGYEIVYTCRKTTENVSWIKKITANIFYKLINIASQVAIDSNTSDFRLIDRKVADVFKKLRKHERFYRGLIKWVGFKQKKIDFDAESRFSGSKKYTLSKMMKLAFQGFLSYSYLPLYSVIFLCFLFIFLSVLYGIFVLYMKFIAHISVPGHSSILLTVLIVAAVQLYAFGILSIYVLKSFQEARRNPIYIVRETKGVESNTKDLEKERDEFIEEATGD